MPFTERAPAVLSMGFLGNGACFYGLRAVRRTPSSWKLDTKIDSSVTVSCQSLRPNCALLEKTRQQSASVQVHRVFYDAFIVIFRSQF